MTRELAAHIVRRFDGGLTIDAQFVHPLEPFSVTALVGPSGCGKTTLLRCLAGLETLDQGRICFAGETWFDASLGIRRTPQQRGIGFLFQEYALFPHRTVLENIAFGLGSAGTAERNRRTSELITLFRLDGLERRRPLQLSGGQQQRVALARTVAPRPRLLLLDEPLSALDSPTRSELRRELRELLGRLGIPTLIVTHAPEEVEAFADRVVVLNGGRVLQSGPVAEVFYRPNSPAVARIVGRQFPP
ncbi:MAG: sulfate/molybdate ABC transporter ATP-binding protein [Planctomycetales bacterium]